MRNTLEYQDNVCYWKSFIEFNMNLKNSPIGSSVDSLFQKGFYLLLFTSGAGFIYKGWEFIIFQPSPMFHFKSCEVWHRLKMSTCSMSHTVTPKGTNTDAHLAITLKHRMHTRTAHCASTSQWTRLRNLKENKQDSRAVRCGVRLLDCSTKRGLFAAFRSIPANRTGSGTLLT